MIPEVNPDHPPSSATSRSLPPGVRAIGEQQLHIDSLSRELLQEVAHAGAAIPSPSALSGHVFVLIGTSTAGKTSIIGKLCQDPTWHERGIDLALYYAIAKVIKDAEPDDYHLLDAAIETVDIANAVETSTIKYKENIDQKTKEVADEALKRIKGKRDQILSEFDRIMKFPEQNIAAKQMYNAIIEMSHEGSDVIFDHWEPESFLKHLEQNLIKIPVTIGES